ncbi:MAG: winged helix-turn-helix domain-containing protein [Candidatus Nezhaarchaeales archaeon]
MGSSRYRSSNEIVFLILKSCLKPMKKTHISYYANLNSFQLTRYLKMLVDNGFLAVTKDNKLVTTHRGMLLVERLEKVFELYEDPEGEGNSLSDVRSVLKSIIEDIGYELYENYTIRGASGVLHVFNYVLRLSPPVVVAIGGLTSNGIEDTNKMLSFIVQVIDVNGYGVYISMSRMNKKLRATLNALLRDEVKRRIKVIDGSSSMEALKEDLYTALCDIPLLVK